MKRYSLLAGWVAGVLAVAVHPSQALDLSEYRTVRTAVTAEIQNDRPTAAGLTGYLGVSLELDRHNRLVVSEVGPESPAALAGVQKADLLLKLAGRSVKTPAEARALIHGRSPGDMVRISLQRGRKKLDLPATLGTVSRPLSPPEGRAVMGVRVGTPGETGGLPISSVSSNQPAAHAGFKVGDVMLQVDGAELGEGLSLADRLSAYQPGDTVRVRVRRGTQELEHSVTLAVADSSAAPPEERRSLNVWKKETCRLAVLLVEFPDLKHNGQIAVRDWQNACFSHGSYTGTNATGQKVFGSVADYYQEMSCGKLRIEGRVFDWVEAPGKRSEHNTGRTGTARSTFFSRVLDAVQTRDGKDALSGFDALAVVYAGERYPGANRGSLLWAHRSSITVKGRSWPYVIVPEGGRRMNSISVLCHEIGHILGLPDLYARPENPGSEGAGTWCAMSNQSPNGRPQHFSAWCKDQLGWLSPAVIDPTVKQKLILAPIEGSTNECFKILVRRDGSEYFLLENRRKKGFDASLAAEGLLIWRVVANRPILEEAHGVAGPIGPRIHLPSVPFPGKANVSFTPYTVPSSRGQLAGGLPVAITHIRSLPDGRVLLHVGYEFD